VKVFRVFRPPSSPPSPSRRPGENQTGKHVCTATNAPFSDSSVHVISSTHVRLLDTLDGRFNVRFATRASRTYAYRLRNSSRRRKSRNFNSTLARVHSASHDYSKLRRTFPVVNAIRIRITGNVPRIRKIYRRRYCNRAIKLLLR